jgi:hypothetical protein
MCQPNYQHAVSSRLPCLVACIAVCIIIGHQLPHYLVEQCVLHAATMKSLHDGDRAQIFCCGFRTQLTLNVTRRPLRFALSATVSSSCAVDDVVHHDEATDEHDCRSVSMHSTTGAILLLLQLVCCRLSPA